MRKFAWLTLVAAAVLFFSAPERAFAHAGHHHAEQTQSATQPASIIAEEAVEHAETVVQSASVSAFDAQKCPHGGNHADCGFCCACSGSAAVALTTPEDASRAFERDHERSLLAATYEVRQAVLDLSRPPKSFA